MAKKYGMKAQSGGYVIKSSKAGKWEVSYQGKVKTHTLSKASEKSLKKAVETYAPALKRLAYR